MNYRYKQLEQDVSALSAAFSELGARFSDAARDVTTGGVMPSERLIEQILTARTAFESVRNAVHRQAESMLVSPLPKHGELASIQAISALLKAAANAEEGKSTAEGDRERASAILSRVLAITHREMAEFKPLQECQTKVGELRNAISVMKWPNRHPEAEAVIGLKHPSTVLLNFVENLDTLEDEKWIALEATITEAYGKPLFVAASRGKLLAQQTSSTSLAPAKPAPTAEKPVEKKVSPEKPVAAPVEPASEKKTAVPPAPVAVAPAEKKESPAASEKSLPGSATPVAPVHVTPAPPTAPVPMAPAAVAQTSQTAEPVASTPVAATVVPPRPPAPVPPTVQPIAASVASAPIASLSALANATESAAEGKPAVTTPADIMEKSRKEPRLASPGPQHVAQTETPQQEQELIGDESSKVAVSSDGGQRPQRWGFWRGNR